MEKEGAYGSGVRVRLLLPLLLLLPAWADPRAEARSKIESLVQKLTAETASLEAERGKVKTHLASCEAFLSTLTSPKDAEAAQVTRAAADKDRASLARTGAALAALNRRVRISREALDNLFQGKHADLRAGVRNLRGKAKVIRKGETGERPLDLDTELRAGDIVTTGPGDRVELEFLDGSRMRIGADSSFQLEQDDPEAFLARLKSGKVKCQVEKLFQRRYSVRTATTAVAVRGTSFTLETGPEGDMLTVHEGEVEVEGKVRVRRAPEEERE